MKGFALCGLLALAVACGATNVGVFGNSRLYNSSWNLANPGGNVTIFNSDWEARGAVWFTTNTITPAFLSNVKVFVTSMVNATAMTPDEQTALVNWVKAGGTLFATGMSSAYPAQLEAFNSIVVPFGITLSGSTGSGNATVLTDHPLTYGLTSLCIDDAGYMTVPTSAIPLLQGPHSSVVGAVIESGPQVKDGRVFVVSDASMITDLNLLMCDGLEDLTTHTASWAFQPPSRIRGHVTLEAFYGKPTGVPFTLTTSDEIGVMESLSTQLDADSNYSVPYLYGGTYKIVAKGRHWLSVRRLDVDLSADVSLDWDLVYNGDANNDNRITTIDFARVLADFGTTGADDGDVNGDNHVGFLDLALMLANFGLKGDT